MAVMLNSGVPSVSFIDASTGDVAIAWRLFLISLYNRTGGSIGIMTTAAYVLPAATAAHLGGVRPDGVTLSNAGGAISVTYGTAAGTAAQGNDTRISGALAATVAASTYAPLVSPHLTGQVTQDGFGAEAGYTFRRAQGTAAAPAALGAGAKIGALAASGYGLTGYGAAVAQVEFTAAGAWSDTAQPAYMTFSTTPPGSVVSAERMRLQPGGAVTIAQITDDGVNALQVSGGARAGSFMVGAAGPTWTTGAGAPAATAPVGSLYSNTSGAVGATLYVSRGAGVWNAVAGV